MLRICVGLPQVHMWKLQQKPEFKRKFEVVEEQPSQPKTEWSVRTRF